MKKTLIIFFVSIVIIVWLFLSAVVIKCSLDLREKNLIVLTLEEQRQKEVVAEQKRIDELNELRGILLSDGLVNSTISEKQTGLCLLAVGRSVHNCGYIWFINNCYDK